MSQIYHNLESNQEVSSILPKPIIKLMVVFLMGCGLMLFTVLPMWAATLFDDFNRASLTGGAPTTYTTVITATDDGANINGSSFLELTNDATGAANASGAVYVTGLMSSLPISSTLSSNTNPIEWTFNFRYNHNAVPTGLNPGSYGLGIILGATSGVFTSASGYAIVYGQSTTPNPIRLVKFTGGLTDSTNLVNIISSGSADISAINNYVSVRVVYTPTGNLWSLFIRDDGASAWADPSSGVTTQKGTASDNTFTGSSMTHFGFIWSHRTTTSQAQFDNFGVSPIVVSGTAPDLAISKSASPTMTMPGGLVTFTMRFTNNSVTVAATNVTITDIIPISLTNLSVISSGASLVQTGGVTYEWTLPILAANGNGMITVTGQVSSSLTTNTILTNVASITNTAGDLTASDNVATATVTVGQCFAMAENVGIVRASMDASALRTAVTEASASGTVRVAGYCAGVDVPTTGQVMLIAKNLTVRGSYTMTDNLATSMPGTYTATLDALGNGRVVNITAGTVTLSDLQVQNGKYNANGGGILANQPITLSNVTVYSNTTNTGNGGGAYFNATANVTATTFLSNTANTGSGGGAYFNATANVTATTFQSNTATIIGDFSGGGGAYFKGIANLMGITVTNNTASRRGGGLYGDQSNLTLVNSYLTNNIANFTGGAIYMYGNNNSYTLTITNTQFLTNSGSSGGAILADSANITVSGGSLFQNNSANGDGGAIYAGVYSSGGSNLVLTSATIISNTASGSGGGIFTCNTCTINITQSKLENNIAANGGGLLAANGGQIVNTLFARNYAATNGSAIYATTVGTLNIIHATIVSPTSSNTKEAIYVNNASVKVNITNTIIASHTTGIARAAGTITQAYNLFYNNTNNSTGGVISGTGSVIGDPAFFDTTSYTLTNTSAAINNGTNANITTDYFGAARPQGGGYDIGYHETNYQTDLVLSKNVTPDNGVAGTAITYTLIFTASGGGVLANIVLTDTMPVSVTNLAVISSGVTITNTGVTPSYVFSIANMVVGAIGRITITGNLSNPLTAHVFTNTALITTTTPQSSTTNDTSSAAMTVGQVILGITKQVTPTTNTTYHGAVTYTVVLSNSGATDALGALFTDTLPLSTTFGTWLTQPSGATDSPNQVTWTGQVTANSYITFSYTVTHTQNFGDVVTNTAQVHYSGSISNATATFTVTKQPIVTTETYYINEDDIMNIVAPGGVLTTAYATDPDGDNLTASLVVSPTQGAFSLNVNGTFIYTPANNFAGTDRFTYTVSDGRGGVATGTVTITVNAANDAPMVGNSQVLYNGAAGVTPTLQAQFIFSSTGPAESFGSGGTTVSTGVVSHYAGWYHAAPFHSSPVMDSNSGFMVRFAAQVLTETFIPAADKNGDGVNDRAGFSVIVLDSNAKGIELGFWTNRIWAQEDGPAEPPTSTLFIQSERASFVTTGMLTYELTISGGAYSLVSGATQILSGSVRDYSAGGAPYTATNFIFLGDNTQSAAGQFKLNYVSVITNATPPDRTVASYTNLPMSDLGVMDLDGGGGSETLTMTVNSGVLTVTTGIGTVSGNGSNTVVITAPIATLNNLLAYSATYVTYRSNLGFYGTDTLTMTLNDKGNTGDVVSALSDSKSFNILVTSPAFSITKSVNNLTPQPNERITYTVIVTNYGNISATTARISDTLPSGLNFAGPITMNPTQGGATLGSLPNLASGVIITANESITITFPVTVTASDGTLITNTAAVTSAQVSTAVSHSVRITVTGTPILTMTKVANGVPDLTGVVRYGLVTYTVIVTNSGTANATGVLFTDTIPANTVFKSWLISPSNTFSSGGVITRNGIVTAGQAITFSFAVSHTGNYEDVVSNTAFINYNSVVSSSVATFTVQSDNVVLTISKQSAYTGTLQPYQTLTYTVRVTNSGTTPATNVTISDTLPANVTLAITQGGDSRGFGGGIVTWTVNSLAANGGNAVLTYVVTVNNVVSGTIITNTAQVTSSEVITPSIITITNVVSAYIDLSVSKSASPLTPAVGEVVTFTVLITNSGVSTATNVVVTDSLPSGLSLASYTPSQGGFTMPTWMVGTITPSTRVTLTMVATVTGSSPMTNAVQVQSVDQTDSDSTPNDGTGDDYAKVIITPTYAVLAITKAVTPTTNVPYHGQVTYTIVISNMSAVNAVNTTLSDTLPLSTTFSSWITSSGATHNAGLISWNGQVTASQRLTFSFVADHVGANYGEVVTNTSVVTYANFVTTSNTATFSVAHIITLTLDKRSAYTSSPAPLQPNHAITYTVVVTNSGSGAASNVTISDTLPANTTFVSSSVTSGITSFASSLYKWTLGTLVPNSPQTLTFRVMVNSGVASGTNIINMATVTSTESTTPISDTVTDTVRYPVSDLQVSKARVGSGDVLAGNQITYTLTITNAGPDTVSAVRVTDTFTGASGIASSVISSTGGGSCANGANVVCDLFSVTGTSVITIVLNTSAAYSGTLTNTAMITFGNGIIASDNDNANNQTGDVTATIRYRLTDLTISKARVGTGYVPAGQPVTYTLTVTNNGADVVNAIVTDTFTGTATLSSITSTAASSCNVGTRSCNLTNLAVSAPQLITVVLTTGSFSGTLTNSAMISATGSFIIIETDSSNNSSAEITTSVQLPTADIEVSKTQVNAGQIVMGSPVTYSIMITNNGPDTVNVTLTDTFTGTVTGLSYSGATCNGATSPFTCAITSFTGTHLITVVLTTGNFSGTLTNTAYVTFTSGVTAVDSVANNNSSTVTTSVRYPTTDLAISKARVGTGYVPAGQPITYTLTVTNNGPDIVNAVVTDTFTGTATLSSITSTVASSCNVGTRSCNLTSLAVGTPQVITVVLTTGSFSGTLTNSARISATGSSIIVETDSSNNTSAEIAAVVQLPVADIEVSKTQVNGGEIIAGSQVTYSLRITNNGPDTVNVMLTDTFTGSYAAVNYSGAGCAGSALPFSCPINGFTGTTQITVVLTTGSFSGTLTNTALVTFTSGVTAVDSVVSNNTSTVTTSVRYPTADLQVSKARVGSGTVLPGGQITYTVIITNLGPDTASVTVTDTYTGTTTSVVSSTTSGSCTMGAQPVCSIPSFTNTQTITFVMTTSTGFSGIFSNSARIGLAVANGTDPNLADNVSEVITALVAGTDLQVSKSVNNATPVGNSNVTYLIQVRNNGPDDATGVVINDMLPMGVTFVSSSTVVGSYDSGTGDWTIGNIAKNSTVSLQITVQTDAVATNTLVTNVATMTAVIPTDLNTANDVATATMTVQVPTVSFQPTTYNIAETGGSILIVATLNATSTGAVTVDYNVTSGSATNGTDYGVANGTLNFPSGTTVQSFTVVITDDMVFESNETVGFTLLNVSANAQIGTANATLTIVDNETPPNASPTAQGNLYVTNQSTVLTVTAPGILANDSDPENNPLTAILATSTSNGILTFNNNGSFIYTPNFGFIGSDYFVYLVNDGTSNSNAATVTITIQALTPPTAVNDSYNTLPNMPLNVTAGAGVLVNDSDPYSLTFIANLVSGPSNGQLTFNSNGSFVYTPTLNFTGNDSYVYRIITTKGSTATATVTIGVNAIPTISFSAANYAVGEAAGSAVITANLSQAYPLTVTVNYQSSAGTATAGTDYGNVTGQLIFAPNVTMQTFTVPITDDVIDENNETINLLLLGAVNATITNTNPATLTITDNDLPPTVNFAAANINVNEGSGAVTITLTLSGTSDLTITVPYSIGNGTATAGSDFMGASGVVTFTPGITSVTIVIPIVNDGVIEGNETFPVVLTGATNATLGSLATTTVTIVETSLVTVQFASASQTVNETAGSATVPVMLSAASANTVTVNYATTNNTALAASDYRAVSGTLTFTPGTVMVSFNVSITDDLLLEGDELINLTLSSPNNATLGVPSTALLTIADNDVITFITGLVAFNDSPTLLGQPTTLSATVTAGSGISYTWSLGDGTTGTGNIVLHTYPAGVYTAVVTASNSLGQLTATTVITIIEPIAGLVVVSDAPTPLGQATNFTATVTAGNFISYTFDFGDNSAPVVLPANWSEGGLTGVLLNHTFVASGTYTVTVTASNGLSAITTTTVVMVVGSTQNAVIDLVVVKQSANPVILGQAITYTIVVTNLGPDLATNVMLTDTLPSSVTLVTLPADCLGTTSLICNIGTLANGAAVTMTIVVRPTQAGLITNAAQVGAAETEVITRNNSSTITTHVGHAFTLVDSVVGGTLVFTNTLNNFIEVSVGAGPQSVLLLLTEQAGVATTPANYTFADYAFNLAFYLNGQLLPNYVVTAPVTITLQNSVINSTDLVLMYNDNGQWVDAATVCNPPSRYTIDPVAHTMQITVCHIPGDFALFTKHRPFIYLPIILQSSPALVTPTPTSISPTATPTLTNPQADLRGSFSLSPAKTNFTSGELVAITVVITNQGTVAAGPFWVDFFINPTTAPQNGSFVWNQQCTLSPCYGLAWQVLGLAPGQSITLNSTASSYSSQHTKWSGLFLSGTTDLYLYVDTWSANRSANGAVLESNETNNRAEIHGLVVTGARNAPMKPFSLELPDRDLPR